MKLSRIASLVALVLMLSAGAVSAQGLELDPDPVTADRSATGQMMHKLGRGVTNVLTCWVEVPRNVAIAWENTDPVSGTIVGAVKGIGWGFARLATGVYETVTFPFAVPADYEAMIEPEFVVTDIWGDHVPYLTDFRSNDPEYPAATPIYPYQFNY